MIEETGFHPAKPTISLCMIVKNEEKFLADCLRAVKSSVDEIIIVDTGSTDRTPDIAVSFNARLYHHPWENHFSKHRNQSLSYAKGDWIFWLDADEILDAGAGDLIHSAIRQPNIDSLILTMICYYDRRTRTSWNNSVKLFKNGQGIRFEGAVHNQVVGFRTAGFCPVKIHHYGYDQDQHTVKKKFQRTSSLLLKSIEADPRNFRHHHDLAVAFASMHLFAKAVSRGLKALELYKQSRETDPNILWTYFVVASAYYNLGRTAEAQKTALEALERDPRHLDSYFVLACIYADQKKIKDFEKVYGKFKRLQADFEACPESLGSLLLNKISEKWRLDLEYGALLLEQDRQAEALDMFHQAAKQTPDLAKAYRLAARLCRMRGYQAPADEFLDKACSAGLAPMIVRFEKALLKRSTGDEPAFQNMIKEMLHNYDPAVGDQEISLALANEALKIGQYQQAGNLLQTVLDQGYETPDIFTSLALALKYQGKGAEALAWNRRALELDENHLHALVNLGHVYYEQKDWPHAKQAYQKAQASDPSQIDVLLRLSLIALMDQDLESCVVFCDRLLTALQIKLDLMIDGIQDLAYVYRLIGEALQNQGKKTLAREALTMAQTFSLTHAAQNKASASKQPIHA